MADEPGAQDEKPQDEKPEVNDVARYRAERDRWKERHGSLESELATLRQKQEERDAAEAQAAADRKKQAGKFDEVEATLKAQIATLAEQNKAFGQAIGEYEQRDKDRIEAILKDRKDAEEIREALDGLPIRKQLKLAERLAATSTEEPEAPTGQPGSLGGQKGKAEWIEEAKRAYPGDEAKQKLYVEQRAITHEKYSKGGDDLFGGGGWPTQQPTGGRG